MKSGNYILSISHQQLSGVALLFSHQYEFELNVKQIQIPLDEKVSLDVIKNVAHQYFEGDYETLLRYPVEAHEDGKVAYTKPFICFIEYVDTDNNYYLSEGKWYQFDKNYLSNVRNEVDKIEFSQSKEITRFDEKKYKTWLKKQPVGQKFYRERYLNDKLAPQFGYINHDRDFAIFDGATVEMADLIRNDTLYVVKLGTPQVLNYAIDQATASIKLLERRGFNVPSNGSTIRVKSVCLWLFIERTSSISKISDINSLIFLMKLATWRKTMLLAGLQPRICVSYK